MVQANLILDVHCPFLPRGIFVIKKDPGMFLSIYYIRAGKNDELREINRIKS